jgi:hypothetical protein
MREEPTSSRVEAQAPATPRTGDKPVLRQTSRGAGLSTRVVLLLALAAIGALALLVDTAPLLGLLLVAAILAGVVAVLVRHSRREHDDRVTLDDLTTAGYEVLHDRVAPGLAGTVRRLVIGPAGVFLVELNDDPGRVRVRGDVIIVGGRSLALGTRLQGQLRAVSAALAPQLTAAGAHVTPLICMRRAELPLFRRRVAGIPVLREAGLVDRIIHAPSLMDEATVAWIADLARSTMPAVRRVAEPDSDAAQSVRPRRALGRGRAEAAVESTEALSEAPSPA